MNPSRHWNTPGRKRPLHLYPIIPPHQELHCTSPKGRVPICPADHTCRDQGGGLLPDSDRALKGRRLIRGVHCTPPVRLCRLPAPPCPSPQDPPFGIHLCGPPGLCVLPEGPVKPVHDDRVRPYRPLPIFRPDTLVQHYLQPEEMRPFYMQVCGGR